MSSSLSAFSSASVAGMAAAFAGAFLDKAEAAGALPLVLDAAAGGLAVGLPAGLLIAAAEGASAGSVVDGAGATGGAATVSVSMGSLVLLALTAAAEFGALPAEATVRP